MGHDVAVDEGLDYFFEGLAFDWVMAGSVGDVWWRCVERDADRWDAYRAEVSVEELWEGLEDVVAKPFLVLERKRRWASPTHSGEPPASISHSPSSRTTRVASEIPADIAACP